MSSRDACPIPLFGAGLVEAIDDETLRNLEDPLDRNGDGVSGRAAIVIDVETGDRRVGRFGWKAQHATLITFGADAYRNEMGITNDLFPQESAFGITRDRMQLCDPFPDPEDIRDPRSRRRGIDNFASFMRFLAPAERGEMNEQVRAGEQVFAAIGCTACHIPVLETGPNAQSPVPSQKGRVVFRPVCFTMWAPATASSKEQRRRTKSALLRCGACDFDARFFMMEPPRWKRRS